MGRNIFPNGIVELVSVNSKAGTERREQTGWGIKNEQGMGSGNRGSYQAKKGTDVGVIRPERIWRMAKSNG
jgi:hypothetical protein